MKYLTRTLLYFLLLQNIATAQTQENYWQISGKSIVLDLTNEERLSLNDNIEMAGKNVAAIIYYEIDTSRNLTLSKDIIFPQLRTFNKSNEPNWKKYRAYFRKLMTDDISPVISHDNLVIIPSQLDSVKIAGLISFYFAPVNGLQITKTIYPSTENRLLVEEWTIQNIGDKKTTIDITNCKVNLGETGYKGKYQFEAYSDAKANVTIETGDTYTFAMYYAAALNDERTEGFDYQLEKNNRLDYIQTMQENLALKTPDENLNMLFYFAKIRAAESIFNSSMGLVHSPGGGNYYVGIWANDQIEYSGPFFPYLGYETGNTAAYNAYEKFRQNIPTTDTHIPYAFEVDGNFPMTHLDRGDAAMTAYGTSRFALLSGDKKQAAQLWELIEWSLEYCHKKRNKDGAIQSESDEMEGRIETGNANLSTSTLYYGGLKYGSQLARELGFSRKAKKYEKRLVKMEKVIENYFGANLEGLNTYKYYAENQHLRHWICLPLTMGITQRKDATLTALFDKLWTENGILVQYNPDESNENATFWDRATLYALRGAFKVGATDLALDRLTKYSEKRLLGDHVPYPVEAYPENNMKHLSAESALYCRIFVEGLLGLEPDGFSRIKLTPALPSKWDFLEFEKLYIFGKPINIYVNREGDKLRLRVTDDEKIIFDELVDEGQVVELGI